MRPTREQILKMIVIANNTSWLATWAVCYLTQ